MGQTQKRRIGLCAMVVWMVFLVSQLSLIPQTKAAEVNDLKPISSWDLMWSSPETTIKDVMSTAGAENQWITVKNGDVAPEKPKDVTVAWVRFKLPDEIPKNYGGYIDRIYAQKQSVFMDGQLIYEMKYDYAHDIMYSLLPLNPEDNKQVLYMRLETTMDRLGINSKIKLGNYDVLTHTLILKDMQNFIIGSTLLIISFIMFICSLFLYKTQRQTWISLSLHILSLGGIFLTFSQFLYVNYPQFGVLLSNVFDVSLAIFLLTLTYFIEKIFENGKLRWVRYFRITQTAYSTMTIAFMFINQMNGYQWNQLYYFMSVTLLGIMMILQFSIISILSVYFVIRGNKEAMIFSIGFATFAIMGILDLVLFYGNGQRYQFILWKYGIIGFLLTLIIILCRRFAINQKHMINYAKELEFYNHQLQLSEKMEMISSLAASVAHEVRNPLQVTRGFLQLVSSSADSKNKEYMGIAIEELDRASVIITDFLTFAKPQLDEMVELNVNKEISQIEGIIVPLATMHGGGISVSVPNDLYILGNSSKLKQVLMNLIKNSIEAFQTEGQIHIWAYRKQEEVWIHIKDNGEGIEPEQLMKLGEPYYSTKTKGTGLGLMVTFRLIDMMKGKVEFKSQRHQGTEVILRFPAITEEKVHR
ncbi:ATP-binding protein [Paenibacillus oryzisoli]|uniref:ATP-binding protein n=1 Tax=Paenibacillus oryzisoli TaxID=1850517 RepID=UPI003D2C2826